MSLLELQPVKPHNLDKNRYFEKCIKVSKKFVTLANDTKSSVTLNKAALEILTEPVRFPTSPNAFYDSSPLRRTLSNTICSTSLNVRASI